MRECKVPTGETELFRLIDINPPRCVKFVDIEHTVKSDYDRLLQRCECHTVAEAMDSSRQPRPESRSRW